MRRLMHKAVAGFLVVFATASFAGTFDAADALFAKREEGSAKIAEARAAYKNLLPTVQGDELVYAVQQLGKLAYFEGELVLDLDTQAARRTEVFADCRGFVERLANMPSAMTQYTYWKLLCTAFWVQSAPLLSRLAQIGGIKRYFNTIIGDDLEPRPELNLDSRYMGGGILRVLAGIYRDDLSALVRSDLPNRSKGIELIDQAIATQAFPGDENGGDSYYANHRGRGDLMLKNGQKDEARVYLDEKIAEIEELASGSQLPKNIEPETRGELVIMKKLRATL